MYERNRLNIRLRYPEDLRLISAEDYKEAFRFAYEYMELKRKYQQLSFIGASSINYGNVGGRGNKISSPTEALALKLADVSLKIALIEDTALEVAGDEHIAKALLEHVGRHIPYDSLGVLQDGISRSAFYRLRNRFYERLSKKLKEVEDDD